MLVQLQNIPVLLAKDGVLGFFFFLALILLDFPQFQFKLSNCFYLALNAKAHLSPLCFLIVVYATGEQHFNNDNECEKNR